MSSNSASLPSVFARGRKTSRRLRDFFSSHIRNYNTRRAYLAQTLVEHLRL